MTLARSTYYTHTILAPLVVVCYVVDKHDCWGSCTSIIEAMQVQCKKNIRRFFPKKKSRCTIHVACTLAKLTTVHQLYVPISLATGTSSPFFELDIAHALLAHQTIWSLLPCRGVPGGFFMHDSFFHTNSSFVQQFARAKVIGCWKKNLWETIFLFFKEQMGKI